MCVQHFSPIHAFCRPARAPGISRLAPGRSGASGRAGGSRDAQPRYRSTQRGRHHSGNACTATRGAAARHFGRGSVRRRCCAICRLLGARRCARGPARPCAQPGSARATGRCRRSGGPTGRRARSPAEAATRCPHGADAVFGPSAEGQPGQRTGVGPGGSQRRPSRCIGGPGPRRRHAKEHRSAASGGAGQPRSGRSADPGLGRRAGRPTGMAVGDAGHFCWLERAAGLAQPAHFAGAGHGALVVRGCVRSVSSLRSLRGVVRHQRSRRKRGGGPDGPGDGDKWCNSGFRHHHPAHAPAPACCTCGSCGRCGADHLGPSARRAI